MKDYRLLFLAEETVEKIYKYMSEFMDIEITPETMEIYIKEAFLQDLLNEIEEVILIKETEDLCSDDECEKDCGECEKLEAIMKKISKGNKFSC